MEPTPPSPEPLKEDTPPPPSPVSWPSPAESPVPSPTRSPSEIQLPKNVNFELFQGAKDISKVKKAPPKSGPSSILSSIFGSLTGNVQEVKEDKIVVLAKNDKRAHSACSSCRSKGQALSESSPDLSSGSFSPANLSLNGDDSSVYSYCFMCDKYEYRCELRHMKPPLYNIKPILSIDRITD